MRHLDKWESFNENGDSRNGNCAGKSPLDVLKDFKKSLIEDSSGEFDAKISIDISDNSRGEFPLPVYKFYIKKSELYPVCFITIRQTYCDLTNEINYYYPVNLTFNFFDKISYDIKDHDDLIERITEVIGSDKTGNFLEHLRRCSKIK